jgi:2-oxo-4-hydroxy-4-carboxy-5-ureidoimidazoline decarboxylase
MAAGREAFVARYGGLVEHSPWVAEAAYERGPFASREDLLSALTDAMRTAPLERRVALIRAHPDLAGKAAIEGRVTADSAREQGSAGLDRLSPDEHEMFTRANTAYRERFGFPFVVCAREHTKDSILRTAAERLDHSPDEEIDIALGEIAKIARLRLGELP